MRMDWRGREGIFRDGGFSENEILDLTEPHFSLRPIRQYAVPWKRIPREEEGGPQDSFVIAMSRTFSL